MANKVIRNVTLKWCNFSTVDRYGHYGCQVFLDKAGVKKMKEIGLESKIKKDEDGVFYFRARRREDDGPVSVVDTDGKNITQAISNGATANIKLDVYEYKRYGGGTTCRLVAAQLLDWEPYDQGEDFDSSEEGSTDDPF